MATRKRMSRKQRIARRNRNIFLVTAGFFCLIIMIILFLKGCSENTDKENEGKNPAQTSESMMQQTTDSNPEQSSTEQQTQTETTQPQTTQETTTQETTPAGNYTSKGFLIEEIDGATYIDGVLIANKTYALPSTFVPTNPENPVTEERSIQCLDKDLMTAWNTMLKDATAKGLNLYISSGYRSYNYQNRIYNNYVKADGVAKADTYSSRPGHSEHQTGLCFDLNTIEDSFQFTEEGKWVHDNCYKYGFCIRFPKGKDAYTGYQYESWHLRYVGVELATKLYNNGEWISLEEYFGITSEYPN